jgi:septal ring factor EnvC (AmiA/AmiB activator)
MKRYSIFSLVLALALVFTLSSCGSKKDEALVAEFTAKSTEAGKLITDVTDGMKKTMDEHMAWMAKLDEAAKAPKADTSKIAAMKKQMDEHAKMMPDIQKEIDSLKSYTMAKTDNNDQLKAAIAGLTTHIAALSANWKMMDDAHTKMGADIMAMMSPAPAKEEAKKDEPKKTAAKAAEIPKGDPGAKPVEQMDKSKHPVKQQSGGAPKK